MVVSDTDGRFTWNLYSNPGLLSITGAIAKDDSEWFLLTIQTHGENADGVALLPEFVCPGCGDRAGDRENGNCTSEFETMKITLKLRIEELPRVVAVLNELYRTITSKLMVIPEFDNSGEWGERESREGKWLVVDPLQSRREPESRMEDLKERLAVLRAFEIISSRLSDDSQKVGLLRPIG